MLNVLYLQVLILTTSLVCKLLGEVVLPLPSHKCPVYRQLNKGLLGRKNNNNNKNNNLQSKREAKDLAGASTPRLAGACCILSSGCKASVFIILTVVRDQTIWC